jgi:enterochelin esterase family protein
MRDIIPMIDAKYRTVADRKSRAIFGFSMGGGQSGRIGLRNLDTFSHVGIMSAGGPGAGGEPMTTLAADVKKTNELIDLLWIGCGREDSAFSGSSAFAQMCKDLGIEHTFVASEGAHHWRVWRRYLRDFSPLLFKTASP